MGDLLNNVLVFDIGSNLTKIGFNNEVSPRSIFPTILNENNFKLAGYESYLKNDQDIDSSIAFPIEHGLIKRWDEFESFLQYIFEIEFEMNAKDQQILLSESPFNTLANKRRLNEIMFEKFGISSLNTTPTHKLSLYASGLLEGTVISCGGGLSYSIPVIDGEVDRLLVMNNNSNNNNNNNGNGCFYHHLEFGGHELTIYMKSLLKKSNPIIKGLNDDQLKITYETAREIKEKFGYVSLNFKESLNGTNNIQQSFQLPDGNTLMIGNESFCCTEPLFHPLLLNNNEISSNSMGIHKIIYDSILKYSTTNNINSSNDINKQKQLFSKLVLSGSTTLFNGFVHRLEMELDNLITSTPSSPFENCLNIIAPENRNISTWIGGSIKSSSVSTFKLNLTTRKQYEEYGENSFLNVIQ